jgi:hypothetical protein
MAEKATREVLLEYSTLVDGPDGRAYAARACGREMEDALWEGWIEFVPEDASAVLRTERETTQPNRADALYWATGLSPVYLEGALARTLAPRTPVYEGPPARPAFDGPAPARQRQRPDQAGGGGS